MNIAKHSTYKIYIYGRKQNVLGLGVLAPNATEYVLYVVQHLSDVANESQCWGTC